jgi:hypothetical protein
MPKAQKTVRTRIYLAAQQLRDWGRDSRRVEIIARILRGALHHDNTLYNFLTECIVMGSTGKNPLFGNASDWPMLSLRTLDDTNPKTLSNIKELESDAPEMGQLSK